MHNAPAARPASQPPAAEGALALNGTALLEEARAKLAAIPSSCPAIGTFFPDLADPCLSISVAKAAGGSMGMGAMGACCAAASAAVAGASVKADVAQLTLAMYVNPPCICPVGQALLFALQQKLITGEGGVREMCSGKPYTGVTDAAYVALASVFGPRCPDVQQQLDAMDDAVLAGGPAGAPPAEGAAPPPPASAAPPAVRAPAAALLLACAAAVGMA
jgi:hypothetical protein